MAGKEWPSAAQQKGITLKLHFQYIRDTTNVGDRSCSPFDYFDWGDATVSDVRESNTPDHDIGIYGGGKIFGGLSSYKGVQRGNGRLNIAWGVGTLSTFSISLRYYRSRRLMDLIGSRDYGDERFDYAPCSSCMAPFFDTPPAPVHDVVFYAHAGKTTGMCLDIPKHIPVLTNACADLETALQFIASGKTVVSNSYHGVYWALLMGRKTLAVPFSNKFGHYRERPHYATAKNWRDEITNAVARPEMLSLVRTATQKFKTTIDDQIAQKS